MTWFLEFMMSFNGTTKLHKTDEQWQHIFVDACLQGIVAYNQDHVYYSRMPQNFKEVLNITHLEMLNVLVAFSVRRSLARLQNHSPLR